MLSSARQLGYWIALALATTALLAGILSWERRHAPAQWSGLPIGGARGGERLFQKKGCARCHAVGGVGGSVGPDLASGPGAPSRPAQLVVAMWNHAPRMWERMRTEGLEYPALDAEEVADVLAYLYLARAVDGAGDKGKGERLYEAKGCARCHAVGGPANAGQPGSLETLRGATSPVGWARAMWNHPPAGGAEKPRFEGEEMNDLLAFTRGERPPSPDRRLLDANPDEGWRLFREKACISCHPLESDGKQADVDLAPGRGLPPTIAQLAGSMWNHAEAMSEAMRARGLDRPRLSNGEMADLIAFLYSFRTAEPGGSPRLGEVLYEMRGCVRCHGPGGKGTSLGPRLRGGGRSYTSISFATALWRHGPRMYERSRELGLKWPDLAEGDVGNLITFLRSSPVGRP